MSSEPILWLVYHRATWDVEGVSDHREGAIRDALERSNITPSDLKVEDFSELDFTQDASTICEDWIAATQEQFREAILDDEHDQRILDEQAGIKHEG